MSKKQPHPSASSDPAAQFFKGPAAAAYDERNRKLAPISENLHFLIRLILGDLPASARILCVGVGTGSEIIKLAGVYPDWTFTGVDPSADMLAVCRARMADENLASRVELCHGHLADLPESEPYDAVLCLLVTQFVKDSRERQAMFQGLAERVKSQGYLINAEISDDLESPKFLQLLEKWKGMIRLSGSTE
ncbi:MAG: class I SAM-dependent methyltransferase, partial [Leptospirales bacterium]